MALRQNSAEGGSNGTTATAGTSGGVSGNQFNLFGGTTVDVVTFSNVHPAHGSLGYRIQHTTGNSARTLVWSGYTATQIAIRSYRYLSVIPSVTSSLQGIFLAGGGVIKFYVNANGTVRIDDVANATVFTSVPTLSANTLYRLEMAVGIGTTTTNGTIHVGVYTGDSTTALISYSSSSVNTGVSDTITNVQFGRPISTANGVAYDDYLDDIAANDGTLTFIGPYVAPNQPPTASAGDDQTNIEPYTTVTLSGTDSDSDGTVVTRAWTQTAGSPTVSLNGSGTTRTYTAPGTIGGTTLTFGYQVTDNGGASSSQDTVQHTILPTTERAVIDGAEVPIHTTTVQGGEQV